MVIMERGCSSRLCSPTVLAKWKMICAFGQGFMRLKRALRLGGSRGLRYQSLGLTKIPPTLGLPTVCAASGWGKEPNPQIRDFLPGGHLLAACDTGWAIWTSLQRRLRHCALLPLWGDHTHMLRVWCEVGLFRDMEQVLGSHDSSDPPLRVGVFGTFASASCVSPLLVFFSHLCGIPGQQLDNRQGQGPGRREISAELGPGMGGCSSSVCRAWCWWIERGLINTQFSIWGCSSVDRVFA